MQADDLAQLIEDYFGLESVTADSRLTGDLSFDSLMWFECLEMLEELAERPIEIETLGTDPTVRDLFNFMEQLSS